jgi:alpha-amylase
MRGGFWRHFLVKYSEVNTLHCLALRASAKVASMDPGPDKTRAVEALWAGEANCAYWHGVFGGIYLPHIRGAAFGNLIAAEALADASTHLGAYARAEASDLDGDGRTDVRLATEVVALTVDPGRGGSMVEWDYRPARRHLGNVLTRRREGYHADILKAVAEGTVRGAEVEGLESIHTVAVRVRHPGLERILVHDRWRRASLRVHLLPADTTLEQMSRDEQEDLGGFATAAYAWDLRETPGQAALELRRRAPVEGGEVSVEREVEVAAAVHGLRHVIRLKWQGADPPGATIAEEWGLGLFGGPEDVWVEAEGRRLSLHEANALSATDRVTAGETHSGLSLSFALSSPATIWTFPLFTISNSESGYERNFQGAVLLLCRPFQPGFDGSAQHTTQCTIGIPPRTGS